MRSIILPALLCFAGSVFGQSVSPSGPRSVASMALPAEELSLPGHDSPGANQSPIQEDLIRSGGAATTFIPIGTAYNIFTILTEGQNQVSWSEELESVIFIHRHNSGTAGGSGGLAFDRSTDGGLTWTTNTGLSPGYNAGSFPGNLGNRYPSATLYNPPGNTNKDAAYVAAAGPALDASAADASWGQVFRNSARTDGAAVAESYSKESGDSEYFPYGLTQNPDGSLCYISGVRNGTGSVALDSINGSKFKIWKGLFNSSTQSFDWTKVATLRPDYYLYSDGGFMNRYNTFTYNLAFSPDGQTGYAVIIGGPVETGFAPITSPRPIIFKSVDAGNTWAPLPDFDFATLPEIDNFLLGSRQGVGPVLPYFTSLDATVDQSGKLHLASEVNSRFTDSADPDSLYFIYLANTQPVSAVYHFTTSTGLDWTASIVDTVRMEDGALANPGSTDLAIGPNAQIGRNADGSKIFFTWAASDPSIIATNDLPDLYGRGFDVASGEYTFISNFTKLTSFDGVAFFPTLSPLVIETGSESDYQLPVVFAVPGTTGADPPQFVYVHGIGFNDEDFGVLAPPPTAGFTFTYIGYGGSVSFTNASVNADSYVWDFGDGLALSSLVNPSHTFPASGNYNVCITAENEGGTNTFCRDIELVSVGIEEPSLAAQLQLGPNPTQHAVFVQFGQIGEVSVELMDALGRQLRPVQTMQGSGEVSLDGLPAGTYQLLFRSQNQVVVRSVSLIP